MCRSKRLSPLPGALLPLGCRERSNEADQDEYRGHQSHVLVAHVASAYPAIWVATKAPVMFAVTRAISAIIITMFPLILHYTVPM